MSIEVDEDLELLERQVPENGLVRVSKGTGTPFNIKLKPRSVTHAASSTYIHWYNIYTCLSRKTYDSTKFQLDIVWPGDSDCCNQNISYTLVP